MRSTEVGLNAVSLLNSHGVTAEARSAAVQRMVRGADGLRGLLPANWVGAAPWAFMVAGLAEQLASVGWTLKRWNGRYMIVAPQQAIALYPMRGNSTIGSQTPEPYRPRAGTFADVCPTPQEWLKGVEVELNEEISRRNFYVFLFHPMPPKEQVVGVKSQLCVALKTAADDADWQLMGLEVFDEVFVDLGQRQVNVTPYNAQTPIDPPVEPC